MSAQGMYETTYTTSGIAISDTAINAAGTPYAQPSRTQPSGAGEAGGGAPPRPAGGGRRAIGPPPSLPPTAKAPYATRPSMTSAKPSASGVSDTGPRVTPVPARPVAIAARTTRIPRAA